MENLLHLYFDKKNERQSIAIYLENQNLEHITLIDKISVYYEGGLLLKLSWGTFRSTIEYDLRYMLKEALEGRLILDESIKKNLGFYYIQYHKNNKRKNLKYRLDEDGNSIWVGFKYQIYSPAYSSEQSSWLYNDTDGNIIFEITPNYPWFFTGAEKGEVVIGYSQWMKSYHPYVVRIIKREVVEQWIKQLDELIEKVAINDEKWTCKGSGCEMCKQDMGVHY